MPQSMLELPLSYKDRKRTVLRRNLRAHGVSDVPRIGPCACGGKGLATLCGVELEWHITCQQCGRVVAGVDLEEAAGRWRDG